MNNIKQNIVEILKLMAVVSHLTIGVANSAGAGEGASVTGAANGAGGGSTVAMPHGITEAENVRPGGLDGNATLQSTLVSVQEKDLHPTVTTKGSKEDSHLTAAQAEPKADQSPTVAKEASAEDALRTFAEKTWKILHSIQEEIKLKLQEGRNNSWNRVPWVAPSWKNELIPDSARFTLFPTLLEKLLAFESQTLDNTEFSPTYWSEMKMNSIKMTIKQTQKILGMKWEPKLTVTIGYNKTDMPGYIRWAFSSGSQFYPDLEITYYQRDNGIEIVIMEAAAKLQLTSKERIGLPQVPAHETFKDLRQPGRQPGPWCLNPPMITD